MTLVILHSDIPVKMQLLVFLKRMNQNFKAPKFTEKEWADLVNFEGNANAIRILTHKQTGKDEGGTQLTFMHFLASIAKYPCEAIAKEKRSR